MNRRDSSIHKHIEKCAFLLRSPGVGWAVLRLKGFWLRTSLFWIWNWSLWNNSLCTWLVRVVLPNLFWAKAHILHERNHMAHHVTKSINNENLVSIYLRLGCVMFSTVIFCWLCECVYVHIFPPFGGLSVMSLDNLMTLVNTRSGPTTGQGPIKHPTRHHPTRSRPIGRGYEQPTFIDVHIL